MSRLPFRGALGAAVALAITAGVAVAVASSRLQAEKAPEIPAAHAVQVVAPHSYPLAETRAAARAAAMEALYDGGLTEGACVSILSITHAAVSPEEWDKRIQDSGGTHRALVGGGVAGDLVDLEAARTGELVAASDSSAWLATDGPNERTIVEYTVVKSASGIPVWIQTAGISSC